MQQGINKRSYEQPADERLNERLRGEGLCKKCDASGVQHSHEVLLQWPLRGHQETSTRIYLIAMVD
ncbi:hypothetical protein ACFIOY_39205 [Bradyrhizobium sp. TZ2]